MNMKEQNQTIAILAGLNKFNKIQLNLKGFNKKEVSDRYFTDTSKIVSCDNIIAKDGFIFSSILLDEKTFHNTTFTVENKAPTVFIVKAPFSNYFMNKLCGWKISSLREFAKLQFILIKNY